MSRTTTGIHGLDALVGGGFIPGRSVLLAGSPGTGKTEVGRFLARQLDADLVDLSQVVKEHGLPVAEEVRQRAGEVLAGDRDLGEFDRECIACGVNPGSVADIVIAAIYVALGEGWEWDCSRKA
jgi:broad-specificity NMP kinase